MKLAINGGAPVSQEPLRYEWPIITPQIKEAVIRQLDISTSLYDGGGIIKEFEEQFSKKHKHKFGLLFCTGTSALYALYGALDLQEDEEVIFPMYTFFATSSPFFLHKKGKAKFVDCDDRGQLDIQNLLKNISNKTKAIVLTHMWGIPCNIHEIKKIATEKKIIVIEDCSHSHGAESKGELLGSIGDAAVFSLQGQKNITGGELGILVTSKPSLYYEAILWGHYNKYSKARIPKEYKNYKYVQTGYGMKLRPHPLAVAMAYESFKTYEIRLKVKRETANYIDQQLSCITGIEPLMPKDNEQFSYYAYGFLYDEEKIGISKEKFLKALHKEGCIEFDSPNSTLPMRELPFYHDYDKIMNISKNQDGINQFENYKNAYDFTRKFIKFPIWSTEESLKIAKMYIKAIVKVIENKGEL